ncbi:MAG: c-type cytochrome [Gallionella sp.]
MFHIKSIISICLAMTVLLACTTKTPPSADSTDGEVMSMDASASMDESTAPAEEMAAMDESPAPVEETATMDEAAPVEETAAAMDESAAPVEVAAPVAVAAKPKAAAPAASLSDLQLRGGPGDPVVGEAKAALCMGCHGVTGNSMDQLIPKLAGQYGKYIAKQVRNYQASIRTHQIMGAIAASVSDEDLADMSAYFGTQTMMKGDAPSNNQVGKNLFENGDMSRMQVPCNNCHGATGKGQNPRNSVFPVIGGQHKGYLLGQLRNFKKGTRNNSPGGVMNIMVQRLSDAELEALADYVSGL